MIVVDGIYSMEGDIADCPGSSGSAREVRRRLAVDDAHSVGVLGPKGDGTGGPLRDTDEVDTDRRHVLEVAGVDRRIRGGHGERDSLPPAPQRAPHLHRRAAPGQHRRRARRPRSVMQREPSGGSGSGAHPPAARGLPELGFEIGPTETPIVPVLIGTMENTFAISRRLFDAGVFTNPVVPPRGAAVPVPAPDQRHGHPHLRPDRFLAGEVRRHRTRAGGHLDRGRAARPATGSDVRRFIDLPYRLHQRDPCGSRRCVGTSRRCSHAHKNPFFEHAEAEYFLAERGDRSSGRIAAIDNRLHNETHERQGRILRLLRVRRRPRPWPTRCFDAAADMAACRGFDTMRGPAVLLGERRMRPAGGRLRHTARAHDAAQPAVLCAPRWSGAGFTKAKDLLVYQGGDPIAAATPGARAPQASRPHHARADGHHRPRRST